MPPIEERLHDLLDQAGVGLVETGRLDACYHHATSTIIARSGLDSPPASAPSATSLATPPTVMIAPPHGPNGSQMNGPRGTSSTST